LDLGNAVHAVAAKEEIDLEVIAIGRHAQSRTKENMLELVIANSSVATGEWTVVALSDFKLTLLLAGLIVITGGLWTVWIHRRNLNQLQQRLKKGSSASCFDRRKHQRRSIVGGLITSCGIVMSGFYWVDEGRAFAILLALLLLLIVGITILAVLDMVSIGLKHGIEQLAEPDTETDRVIAAAIAKHHSETSQALTDDNGKS